MSNVNHLHERKRAKTMGRKLRNAVPSGNSNAEVWMSV